MIHKIARWAYTRCWVLPRIHRKYSRLSVSETFTEIYATKSWGERSEGFSSGAGSSGQAAEQYLDLLTGIIERKAITSVVDLGCGDFQVGRQLVSRSNLQYIGVDVVQALIDHNIQHFSTPQITFKALNILSDPLPGAELCIVRQVLQHLSNDEIRSVLKQVKKYPLVLISEHVPSKTKSVNRDKIHGPDVRAYFGSGVYPDKPPFSELPVEIWETQLSDGILRTLLIQNASA